MANGADGSIIIDTQLDSTGFQRGSKRMQDAIRSLNTSMAQSGTNMAGAVQSMNSALQNMGNAAQTTGSKIAKNMGSNQFDSALSAVQKSVGSLVGQLTRLSDAERVGVSSGAGMTRFTINVEKAREALNSLSQKMLDLGNQQVNTVQYEKLQAEFEHLDKIMEGLYKKQEMFEALGVSVDSKQYDRLAYQIDTVGEKYDAVVAKLREMRESGGMATQGMDSAAYQSIAQQLSEMAGQLQHFEQVSAGFGQQMQAGSQQAEEGLSSLEGEIKHTPPHVFSASRALSGFGSILKTIGSTALSAVSNLARLSFRTLVSGAKNASSGIKGLIGALKNLRGGSKQSIVTSNGLVKALFGVKRMLLSRIKRTFISTLFNSLKTGMQSFAKYSSSFNTAMSSMKNSMTGFSGNLAVFAGNLISAIAPAISTILDLLSKAMSYINAFFALLSGKSTYTVAKKGTDDYAKSLKSAGGAAKDLKAQVYGFDELNKEQDSSGGGGSGASSTGFAEKSISSIPGYLLDLMNAIKEAFATQEFEKVGALVAAELNRVVTSIDKWINDVFRPAGEKWAAIVARILNGFVDAFDFYNLGKTVADGLSAIFSIFDTFLVTFNWSRLAEQFANGLNGVFQNLEWDTIGRTIGHGLQAISTVITGTLAGIDWIALGTGVSNGLNNVFATVDFQTIGQQTATAINGILEGIHSLIETADYTGWATRFGSGINAILTGIDWNMLGSDIGDGFGMIVSTLLSSINAIQWNELGTMLGNGANSMVNAVPWTEMAVSTGEGVNGIVSGISNAITTFDWINLGESFARYCNTIIDTVDWGQIGQMLGDAVEGLYDFIIGGIAAINWAELGTQLANSVDSIFQAIDWGLAGTQLSDALKGLLDGINQFLVNTNWQQIGNDVAQFLGGIDWNGLFQALCEGIGHALVGIGEFIWGLIETAWASVETWWSEQLNLSGGNVIDALLNGIINALTGLADWIDQNIITPFLTSIGLLDPELLAYGGEAIGNFVKGIGDGVADAVEKVTGYFRMVFDSIADVFSDIGDIASNIWTGFKNGIASGVESAKSWVSEKFNGILNGIKGVFGIHSPSTEMKSVGENVQAGFEEGITSKENSVLESVKSVFSGIWNAIKNIFGVKSSTSSSKEAKQAGSDLMDGIKSGIESGEKSMKKTAQDAAKSALEAIRDALGISGNSGPAKATQDYGEGIVLGLAEGVKIKSTASTFSSSTKTALDAVKSALRSALGMSGDSAPANSIKSFGEGIVYGIRDGLKNSATATTFSVAIESVKTAVISALTTALSISGTSARITEAIGEAIVLGIRNGITDASGSGVFNSAAETIKNTIMSALNSSINSSGFSSIGGTISSGIANGIRSGSSSVSSAVTSVINGAVSKANSAASQIGTNVSAGVSTGVSSSSGSMLSSISNSVKSMISTAKNVLGIKSPSKVFAEIGQYTVAGLVKGIDENEKLATRATSELSERMIAAADAIAKMSGLRTPTISTGSFAPYKTRVLDSDTIPVQDETRSGNSGIENTGAESVNSLIQEYKDQSFDTRLMLREIIDAILGLNLTVDGESLTRKITQIQKTQERNFGGAYA